MEVSRGRNALAHHLLVSRAQRLPRVAPHAGVPREAVRRQRSSQRSQRLRSAHPREVAPACALVAINY